MHELSIAHAVISTAADTAARHDAARVTAIRLRIGTLSGVVPDALRFAFDVAAAGSVAEGATLEIDEVPITVHCRPCAADVELADVHTFRCPRCGFPTAEVVGGRELEIVSITIATTETACP